MSEYRTLMVLAIAFWAVEVFALFALGCDLAAAIGIMYAAGMAGYAATRARASARSRHADSACCRPGRTGCGRRHPSG